MCGGGDVGAVQNGRAKPVGRLYAEDSTIQATRRVEVQAPSKKKEIQKVAESTFNRQPLSEGLDLTVALQNLNYKYIHHSKERTQDSMHSSHMACRGRLDGVPSRIATNVRQTMREARPRSAESMLLEEECSISKMSLNISSQPHSA